MNTYKAFYKGKSIEIKSETQYGAQLLAAKEFGAKKSYDVSIVLLAIGEREIIHKPQDICP